MPGELTAKAAIVGIGATDFSKNSGRSELRLAAEAVLDALDDAGLTPADVDGMVTFTMDSNTEVAIARATGIGELKFFSEIHHGGGAACATIQQAAIAVAAGLADCVVVYRAFNERSGMRSARCRCGWWRTPTRRAWTTRSRIRTGCRRRLHRWR
jgi:acetyl-CoA acetyltransferase